MYTQQDLDQRFVIIKNAGLEDATILDENYKQMICAVPNNDEKDQIKKLIVTVQARIKELKDNR